MTDRATPSGLSTRPLGPAFGMEIGGADLKRVTDAQMADILECFDRASALLIREQALSPSALGAFSRRLGGLDEAALEAVVRLSPGVVLLGTGAEQHFPPSSLLAPLLGQGIGIEVMTTAAACRTFNILVAEGRSVAAGLFIT